MNEIENWVERKFNPWKQAMIDYEQEVGSVSAVIQRNAAELKYVISLMLDKREAEAVKIWNNLELNPKLEGLQLNIEKDELVMIEVGGTKKLLSITSLLGELEEMLNS